MVKKRSSVFKRSEAFIMADENKEESVETVEAVPSQEVEEQVVETAEDIVANAEITRLTLEGEAKDKLVLESAAQVKRLQADFDNFRRRTRQEKEELSAVVAQSLIKDLLPLLDNFERAITADVSNGESPLKDGVVMIYKQLFAALEKNGLEKIAAVGEKFDPNFHEAIMRVADETKEEDTVVEELQSGYSVRGRVIRPSMVKVIGN